MGMFCVGIALISVHLKSEIIRNSCRNIGHPYLHRKFLMYALIGYRNSTLTQQYCAVTGDGTEENIK